MDFNPVQTNQRPVCEKLAQRIWEFVRPVVFGCSPWFARRWRVQWLRFASVWFRGSANSISSGASVSRTARIDYPWNLSIGGQSSIGAGSWVHCLAKVAIGENVV